MDTESIGFAAEKFKLSLLLWSQTHDEQDMGLRGLADRLDKNPAATASARVRDTPGKTSCLGHRDKF